jgi:phage tail protein X
LRRLTWASNLPRRIDLPAISNGQQWAELTQGAPARNEDPAIDGTQQLSGSAANSAGGGTTTAQANETLSAASWRVYGDSRYWFVLAEANGFGIAVEALPGGILLRVPELRVTRNNADTFKTYKPMKALGRSRPRFPHHFLKPWIEPWPTNPAFGRGCSGTWLASIKKTKTHPKLFSASRDSGG